jgi:hypothetical protein
MNCFCTAITKIMIGAVMIKQAAPSTSQLTSAFTAKVTTAGGRVFACECRQEQRKGVFVPAEDRGRISPWR